MNLARRPNRCAQALLDAYALVTDPVAAAEAEPSARHRAWQMLKSQRGQTCSQRRRAHAGAPFGGDAA